MLFQYIDGLLAFGLGLDAGVGHVAERGQFAFGHGALEARHLGISLGVDGTVTLDVSLGHLQTLHAREGRVAVGCRGALADNGFPPETAAVAAIKAGVNILMLSEKRFVKVAEDILEKAKTDKELSENIEKSVKKIIGFKIGKI